MRVKPNRIESSEKTVSMERVISERNQNCEVMVPITEAVPAVRVALIRNLRYRWKMGCLPLKLINHEMVPAVIPKHWIMILVLRVSDGDRPRVEKAGMKTMPPPAPVELATIAPPSPSKKK